MNKKESGSFFKLYVVCLILAAFSLRSSITSVGPVVSLIKEDLNMTSGQAGTLTTIPMLLFSVTAFFAGAILPRFKIRHSSVVCFACTGIGLLIRSYLGLPGLYIGTVLIGFGIGVMNVMLPALNRQKAAQKIGVITGVYNVSMNFMAGMGSGFSYKLAQAFGSWRPAISIWCVFPFIAIPLWLNLTGRKEFDDKTGESYSPIAATKKFLTGKVWAVSALMALQCVIYFSCVVTWFPTMMHDKGIDSSTAGVMTMGLQLISLIPAFISPVLAQNPKNRPYVALCGGGVYFIAAMIYLTCKSFPMMCVCAVLCGLGSGFCYSYVLALISMSGKSPAETTWISGFAQMIGYAVSAVGPTIFGMILDASGQWTIPMIIVAAAAASYAAIGIIAGKSITGE